MLSLITIVYHYTMADTKYQIYVPLLVAHCVIDHTNHFQGGYGYRFNNSDATRCDVCYRYCHYGDHFSRCTSGAMVLTFLTIFAMLYTAISNKISFLMVSLASLIGVVVFYISYYLCLWVW